MATGDLNEYKIHELVAARAPIDVFGVGTELATSADAPSLGVVYKLVEMEDAGGRRYTAQAQRGQAHLARRQTDLPLRRSRSCWRGPANARLSARDPKPAEALLRPVILGGRLVEAAADGGASAPVCRRSLARLPAPCHSLFEGEDAWRVELSPELEALNERVRTGVAAMKTVFFDVDTQIDFLFPPGACTFRERRRSSTDRGAEPVRCRARNPRDLDHGRAHRKRSRVPAVAAALRRGHAGTAEAGRHAALENGVVVPNVAPVRRLDGAQQILLEKQTLDCFTNVNLRRILDRLGAERYVVYGVVTEICVQLAAFGLLKTGKRVELVTDAVRSLEAEAAAARMTAGFHGRGRRADDGRPDHRGVEFGYEQQDAPDSR